MPEVARFHDAPIYEAHRTLTQMRSHVEFSLSTLPETGTTSDWNEFEVYAPAIQFFRRDWTFNQGISAFLWYSYVVPQLSEQVLLDLYSYLGHHPKLLEALSEFVNRDPEAETAIHTLKKLFERKGNSAEDRKLAHHNLVMLLSKIPTSGFLLSPLYQLWTELPPGGRPVAYLVHVQSKAPNAKSLPRFVAWHLRSTEEEWTKCFETQNWRTQEHVAVMTNPRLPDDRRESVRSFFQEWLFPALSYAKFPPPEGKSAAVSGQEAEGTFGYLILPLFLFHENSNTETAPVCAGDWVGALSIHLRVKDKDNLPKDAQRLKESLDSRWVIRFLRSMWASADTMLSEVIESVARRSISGTNSNGTANTIEQAFSAGLKCSLGWEVDESEDITGRFDAAAVHFDTEGCSLQLNWEWPREEQSISKAVTVKEPVVRSEWDFLQTDLQHIIKEKTFWITNRIYRSVYTQWHAWRHIQQGMPEELRRWMDATKDWFDDAAANAGQSILHTFEKMKIEDHKKIVKTVFPCFPEEWWDKNTRGVYPAKWLHDALKYLFGKYSMVSRSRENRKPLTIGALFVLFVLAWSRHRSEELNAACLYNIDFDDWWNTPVVEVVPDELAEDLYVRLYRLFDELSVKRRPISQPISIEIIGPGIKVQLGWEGNDSGNSFFERYTSQLERLCNTIPSGSVVGHCAAVALIGSTDVELGFTPWPLFKLGCERQGGFLVFGGD